MLFSESKTAGLSSFAADSPRFSEDIDSTCSTPFVSAPSSPGNGPSGYFFSAPASPMHFLLTNEKKKPPTYDYEPVFLTSDSGSFEFEFSSRFSPNGSGGNGSMTSADELFFNGQIRPMKLLSHLQRQQEGVTPFVDLYSEHPEAATNGRGRDPRARNAKYSHRKARSMSPLRTNAEYEWQSLRADDQENEVKENESSETTTPSCSASSSRSSSSGRNSKKWMFLKDLLNRSKSEGRVDKKERLWSAISFSMKDKKTPSPSSPALSPSSSRDEKKGKSEAKKSSKVPAARKPANGVWKRRSAHELHYTAYRAHAEEMKKKTFLPYKQGLLGCLGFSSKSYGAFSGFTRTLNPISSK